MTNRHIDGLVKAFMEETEISFYGQKVKVLEVKYMGSQSGPWMRYEIRLSNQSFIVIEDVPEEVKMLGVMVQDDTVVVKMRNNGEARRMCQKLLLEKL